MRINCEVEVTYSLSHGGAAGKSSRSKAAICLGRKEASKSRLVCQDKKNQIFLLLITAKNSSGTKYFVRQQAILLKDVLHYLGGRKY